MEGSDTSVCKSDKIDALDVSGVDGDSYFALRPIAFAPGMNQMISGSGVCY